MFSSEKRVWGGWFWFTLIERVWKMKIPHCESVTSVWQSGWRVYRETQYNNWGGEVHTQREGEIYHLTAALISTLRWGRRMCAQTEQSSAVFLNWPNSSSVLPHRMSDWSTSSERWHVKRKRCKAKANRGDYHSVDLGVHSKTLSHCGTPRSFVFLSARTKKHKRIKRLRWLEKAYTTAFSRTNTSPRRKVIPAVSVRGRKYYFRRDHLKDVFL